MRVKITGNEYWLLHRVLGGLPVIVGYDWCQHHGSPDAISLYTDKGKPAPWAEDRMSSDGWHALVDVCKDDYYEQKENSEADRGDYLYEQRKDA